MYNGGSSRLTSREFMKVVQLMLQDGVWNGKRILSSEWVRKSTSPLRNLTKTQQYGWLWNSVAYPYKGRTVRAFFAAGNGGQIYMGVPELDLVIVFTGGSYGDASLFIPQRQFVPNWILPAVD